MSEPIRIVSRANPLVGRLRRLARDGSAYRRQGLIWLEGEHLCAAALARGLAVQQAVVSEQGWGMAGVRALAGRVPRLVCLPDALFGEISALESPGSLGFVLPVPAAPVPDPELASAVLDRVQDAGNVGSILRSAAALGVRQVLAIEGTASLWSPKVVRSGMGAHFALRLVEGLSGREVAALGLNLVGTSSHAGEPLPAAALPEPAAWLFGHEGQGASPELLAACRAVVRIPQPGGEESLNVAAAAAICLYEAARRRQ